MKESKVTKIVSEGIRNVSKVKLKPSTTTRYMLYRAGTCDYPVKKSIRPMGDRRDVNTLYEVHTTPLRDTLMSVCEHCIPLQPFNFTDASDNPS